MQRYKHTLLILATQGPRKESCFILTISKWNSPIKI